MNFTARLKTRFCYLLVLFVLTFQGAFGQLTIDSTVTTADMLSTLLGPGVTVSGVTLNCPTNAYGTFSGGTAALGFPSGIMLTSGNVGWVPGPNTGGASGSANGGLSGDPMLDALAGVGTNDACILEFDFVSTCDSISFQYVFGSEEYPEWVGSFNDIFGFFLSGPGIAGVQNIATIPGTSIAVSINSVNSGSYPMYYVDNTAGALIGYDGYTTGLVATAPVYACSTYHVRIAVADALDDAYDSGVFIAQGGFSCGLLAVGDTAVEGCKDAIVTIDRSGPVITADTVIVQYMGTALMGTDYATVDTLVIFPAGVGTQTITFSAFDDGIPEGTETILVIVPNGACGIPDTIRVVVLDPPAPDAGPDQVGCTGTTFTLGAAAVPGYSYSWSPSAGLSSSTSSSPTVTPPAAGVYTFYLTATDGFGCTGSDTVVITVADLPVPSFSHDPAACIGTPVTITYTSGVIPGAGYIWNFGAGASPASASTIGPHSVTYSTPGTQTISLMVTLGPCSTSVVTDPITIWPTPVASIAPVANQCLTGNSFNFAPGAAYGPTATFFWTFGPGATPVNSTLQFPSGITFSTSGIKTATLVVTENGCPSAPVTINFEVWVQPVPDFDWSGICHQSPTSFTDFTSGSMTAWNWNFADGGASSTLPGPVHTFSSPGQYNVQLTVTDANGCTSTGTETVTVHPLPVPDFTYENECFSSRTVFTNATSLTDPWGSVLGTYNWNFGDPASGAANTSADTDPVHNYTSPGTYTVTLTAVSDIGCSETLVRDILVETPPVLLAGHDSVCAEQSATLWAYNALPGTEVVWMASPGSSAFFHTGPVYQTPPLAQTSTYYIAMQDDEGCLSTPVPITAFMFPLPGTLFEALPAAQVEIPNAIVEFNPYGFWTYNGVQSIQWTFGDGSSSTEYSPIHQYSTPGLYTVTLTVTDLNGCTGKTVLENYVQVTQQILVWVPNAFTPNGDDHNELFFFESRLVKQLSVQIYDRWGAMVFQSDNLNFTWDGRDAQGRDLPEGTYTWRYTATAIDNTQLENAGTVMLLR